MLGQDNYCPILYARVAEMKALLQLPAIAKDGMLPLIIGRPWPNARALVSTWNKATEAVGGRRYALDLDRLAFNSAGSTPALVDFNALFSRQNGYGNYYDLIVSLTNVVPVLRPLANIETDLPAQAERIIDLDRGLVVRLEFGQTPNPTALVDGIYAHHDLSADVSFIVDVGWGRDLINREVWASMIVTRILQHRSNAEIVIAGSSFPDEFTNYGQRAEIRVEERRLHMSLQRRFNARLIYGDWGSTRPPRPPTPMHNVPRIDLPTRSDWIAFRRDKDVKADETYEEIARRTIQDADWPRDLNIWGTYMIAGTADGLPEAIRGAGTAAAVRINIHLHQQRFFDAPQVISDGDEPYTDI